MVQNTGLMLACRPTYVHVCASMYCVYIYTVTWFLFC